MSADPTGETQGALLKLPLLDVPLAAFDVETTGLAPSRGHRVVELAVVRREPDGRRLEWSSLVDPERRIPPEASRVHRIVDDHLIGAPRFPDVVAELLARLEGAALVAHNAPFDLSFLDAELSLAGHVRPGFPVIDTLALARRFFDFPRNNLETVCRSLGVPLEGAHTARADAAATLRVLERMAPRLAERGMATVGDLQRKRTDAADPALIAALRAVAAEGRTARIRYPGRGGRPYEREVAIETIGGNHLEGWCLPGGERRTFRLDRIQRVEPGRGSVKKGTGYELP